MTHTKNFISTTRTDIQRQNLVDLNKNKSPRGFKVTLEPSEETTIFQITERVTVSQWNLLEPKEGDTSEDNIKLFEVFPVIVEQTKGDPCSPCEIPVIEQLTGHNEREFKDCKGNSVILSHLKPRVTLSEVGLFKFKRSDFGSENADLYFYWDDINPKNCL